MKKLVFSPPKFGFILGTRAAGAFGLGLLASRKISRSQRRSIGRSLVALGLLTTIPALMFVFRGRSG